MSYDYSPVVLHLSPHPDDELIGAPATLLALKDLGWRVVNLALGLGSNLKERPRREAELKAACEKVGFEVLIPNPPESLTEDYLARLIKKTIKNTHPQIVMSPSLYDRHPSHEQAARALKRVLNEMLENAPRWWRWGLWGELKNPTIVTYFPEERLQEIMEALACHQGEVARNDYLKLVQGRAMANSVLGQERVFGFGSNAPAGQTGLAELVSEAVYTPKGWRLGTPHILTAEQIFLPASEREDQ